MMQYNKNKSDFLGMSYGKANHLLRKSILFHYIVKCGEDFCFRCNDKIVNIEELSIEHKKDWLNVSELLFWDLDNITFSHLKCNINAQKRQNKFNGSKTHCLRGHEFNIENTYLRKYKDKYVLRSCRACLRNKMRKTRELRKGGGTVYAGVLKASASA